MPSGFEDLCQTSVDLEASMYEWKHVNTLKDFSIPDERLPKTFRSGCCFIQASRNEFLLILFHLSRGKQIKLKSRLNNVVFDYWWGRRWPVDTKTCWTDRSNNKFFSLFCAYLRFKLMWFFVKVALAWLITWCDMECMPEGAITFTCLVSLVREIKHCDEKKSFIFHLAQISLSHTARFKREIIKFKSFSDVDSLRFCSNFLHKLVQPNSRRVCCKKCVRSD